MRRRVKAADVPEGGARVFELEGVEVAIFCRDGRYRALGARCPHVRGPLVLGRIEGDEVICPWHGARFDLDSGRATRGPTEESVPVYPVRRVGDELEVELPGQGSSANLTWWTDPSGAGSSSRPFSRFSPCTPSWRSTACGRSRRPSTR